jgi:hypothetical protein
MFLSGMEFFFAYADYSIALDYLEVIAEGKGIQTVHGRRSLSGVPLLYPNESKSERPSEAVEAVCASPAEVYKPARPISRYNIPVRLVRAIKRYGLREVFRFFLCGLKQSEKAETKGLK